MSNRAKLASQWLLALAACCTSSIALTAHAQDGMRPVPRFAGTSIRDKRTDSQKAGAASSLQWRTSSEVSHIGSASQAKFITPSEANDAQPAVTTTALAAERLAAEHTDEPAERIDTTEGTSIRFSGVHDTVVPVLQAKYQNTPAIVGDEGSLQVPRILQLPPTAPKTPGFTLPPGLPAEKPSATPQNSSQPVQDVFKDPFGDDPATDAGESPSIQMPPSTKPKINNELRPPAPKIGLEPAVVDATKEPNDEDLAPQAETSDNPFDRKRSEKERAADADDKRQLEDFDMPLRSKDKSSGSASKLRADEEKLKKPTEFSCDKFRASIAAATLQKVSLDISPPFRPDVIELDEFRKLKTKFDEGQEVRDWQSIDGRKLGRGRLKDLAYEKVVIETEFGTTEQLPINRISEADLAYLSKNWGLPQECLIEQATYHPRSWRESTMTWKASNLCHKPLYFEEVNLERYGHDAGPFAQPVISTAHFFANIAVLPYKMGVHSPTECQYALGYYRPGNCAPWIVPPIPLSLRGGLYQAAAMTGAFWLIP